MKYWNLLNFRLKFVAFLVAIYMVTFPFKLLTRVVRGDYQENNQITIQENHNRGTK